MVTTFDKKIVGVAVKLLAGVCAGNEDEIVDCLTGYLWSEEEAGDLKGAKNTEQQLQPDIGDAPAILDNTVELDGVLYRV